MGTRNLAYVQVRCNITRHDGLSYTPWFQATYVLSSLTGQMGVETTHDFTTK